MISINSMTIEEDSALAKHSQQSKMSNIYSKVHLLHSMDNF